MTDGVGHVTVIAPKAVHPPDNERITCPKLVEEPLSLGTFSKARAYAGYAVVGKDFINNETGCLSLGDLVI